MKWVDDYDRYKVGVTKKINFVEKGKTDYVTVNCILCRINGY